MGTAASPVKKRTLFQCSSFSAHGTIEAGRKLAKMLQPGDLVTFSGELGAGKTTFIKGLISEISSFPLEEIVSPTFTYLQIYPGSHPIHHFDLYRLHNVETFHQMGFLDYLQGSHTCLIEWSERILSLLPQKHIEVQISYNGETAREIVVYKGTSA